MPTTGAATPAVMAALGALGSTVPNITTKELRAVEIDHVLHQIDGIDWMRGQRWDGICGKLRADGVFSTAGGAKDSGHATFNALTDSTGLNYQRIRHTMAANGNLPAQPIAPAVELVPQTEPAPAAEPVPIP
jgi:hypothetical protein